MSASQDAAPSAASPSDTPTGSAASQSAAPSGAASGGSSNTSVPHRPSPLRSVQVSSDGESLFGSASYNPPPIPPLSVPTTAFSDASLFAGASRYSSFALPSRVNPDASGVVFGSGSTFDAARSPFNPSNRGSPFGPSLSRAATTTASSATAAPSSASSGAAVTQGRTTLRSSLFDPPNGATASSYTSPGEPSRTTPAEGPSHNPDSTKPRSHIVNAPNMGAWEPATTSSYDGAEMVTLLVGPEERQLLAHKSYLSLHSGFFKAALKKEWVEGQTRTVKLPDEEPDIVAQYLDYTYGKGLLTASKPSLDPAKGRVYEVLTELFALGERLLDSSIRNAIINEIIKLTTVHTSEGLYYPGARAINNIYNCTTSASPARRLMVELYVTAGKKDWFTDDLHPAFVMDLGKELMSEVQSSTLPCRSRKGNTKAGFYRIFFG